MKRAKKENALKQAMGGCLAERGHTVVTWNKADRKNRKAKVQSVALTAA